MLEAKVKDLKDRYDTLKSLIEIFKVRLKLIEEISKTINSNVPLEEALNASIELVLKLFKVPAGSIMLLSRSRKYMNVYIASGHKAEEIKKFRISIGEGIAGKVALSGKPMIVTDTKKSPDFNREIGKAIDYYPKNILCVPIRIKEKILGVIEIMDKPGQIPFNDDDVTLLTSISNTVGIVIENVNLYHFSRSNVDRLSKLIDISKIINTTMDLRQLLQYIMDTAKIVLKAEGSSLMLIDEEKKELYFNITTGKEGKILKQIRIPMGKGVAGLVALNGKPLLIEDALHDNRVFRGVDKQTKMTTRTILAVPMHVKSKVVGVLEVINSLDKPCFDQNDMDLFQAFADHAGIAIYNRELILNLQEANRELNRRLKEISAMYEISEKLANETDLDKVFDISIRVISDIFQLKHVSLMLFDEKDRVLKIKSAVGIKHDLLPSIKKKSGEIIAGEVFEKDKPVLITDMDKEPQYGKHKRSRYKTSSFICVPIRLRGKPTGVLNVTDKKNGELFDNNELKTFITLSNQISKNYENIIYYNEFLEKQRIEKELEITRHIQQHVLPKEFPKIKGIDVSATSIPAREVGGDFYDYIDINNKSHAFLIADVSGKSLPASMFMALSRSITRVQAHNLISPARVLGDSNKYIYKDSESGMFVTMFYMVAYLNDNRVHFGSAGHNEQIFFDASEDEFKLLKVKGIPLGISPDSAYLEDNIQFRKGDIIILYTDGVTEALNRAGDEFGLDRLKDIIKTSKQLKAKGILNTILKEITLFTQGTPQFDDLTLLVIKFTGSSSHKINVHELEVKSHTKNLKQIGRFLQEHLNNYNIKKDIIEETILAVDEAATNIIVHSYKKDPHGYIRVKLSLSEDRLIISLFDNGGTFNPKKIDTPNLTKKLEKRQLGGLGIYLMKKFMDDVRYYIKTTSRKENEVRMIKNLRK
ncbi:MAG: GAF domain-containing protein [Spirochaetes bacterium]|nr:GAF domain-containing protein [Spirochaetota bacterium]